METPTPTLDANRDAIRKAYRAIAAIPAPAHAWTVVIAREALAAAERGELSESLFAAIDAWSYASTAEAPAYRSLAYVIRAAIEAPPTPPTH